LLWAVGESGASASARRHAGSASTKRPQAQSAPEIVVRLGVIGRKRDGAAVVLDRVRVALQPAQRNREIVMGLGVVGSKRGEARQEIGGGLVVVGFLAQHAKKVEGRAVIGRGRQDAGAKLFRLRETSGRAQRHRFRGQASGVERRAARWLRRG
jgi:hypothetical protein